jgi:hypothetical protein
MKTSPFRIFVTVLLLSAGALSAVGEIVLSPAKRQEALERGKALMAPREVVPIAVDPFHPQAFADASANMSRTPGTTPAPEGEVVTRAPSGPRSDRDLLQAIAATLKPSGSMVLPGGQMSLSFGQKRVKAGGVLTITFEGSQYTLEIVSIDRTNFTLRLNREEFTRTIK